MAQKYGVFSNGNFCAFYSTEIHGDPGSEGCMIPQGAVPLTDDQWLEELTFPGTYIAQNGEVVPA